MIGYGARQGSLPYSRLSSGAGSAPPELSPSEEGSLEAEVSDSPESSVGAVVGLVLSGAVVPWLALSEVLGAVDSGVEGSGAWVVVSTGVVSAGVVSSGAS